MLKNVVDWVTDNAPIDKSEVRAGRFVDTIYRKYVSQPTISVNVKQ